MVFFQEQEVASGIQSFLFSGRKACGRQLNDDELCHNLMAELLKKYYGYEGAFVMENDPEREVEYRKEYFHE